MAQTQSRESLEDEIDLIPPEIECHDVSSSSSTSPTPDPSEEASRPGSRLDWLSTLSPVKRSGVNFGNTEVCVNKAMANLEALKQIVTMRAAKQRGHKPKGVRPTVTVDSPSDLSVEGTRTGTILERLSKVSMIKKASISNANAIISSVLNLVARLEHDRQDTRVTLTEQEVKSQDMNEDLGKEEEKRQELLLQCTQAEHEKCARIIRELKWNANFQGRKLRRLLEAQAYLVKKNNNLRLEVNRLKELNPQLLEKVQIEQGKIKNISRMQRETVDDLHYMERELQELEDQCRRIHLVAESERKKTKEKKANLSMVLDAENAELDSIRRESTAISQKIRDTDAKAIVLQTKIKKLEAEVTLSQMRHNRIKSKVEELESEQLKLLSEKQQLQARKQALVHSNEEELEKLEEAYSRNVSVMEDEERHVVKTKRERDDLDHDIETLKETIILTKLKIADNEKSTSRAYREIERLDQQLEISLLEYNHAYRSHRRVKEEYKLEKARTDESEDNLKDTIEGLKKKIREQYKTKILFENKTKAQMANMKKLMAEYEKQENRVLETVEDAEQRLKLKVEKAQGLQDMQDEQVRVLEENKVEVTKKQEKLAVVETQLGGKKSELTVQEKDLKAEMVEKVQVVETTTERIKDLEGKMEDKEKSIAMLIKMKHKVAASLEALRSELNELEEKLAIEAGKEQSWKDEFKEISDFAADADSKHIQYLKERHELLKQQNMDLEKSLCTNTELAVSYHQLQCEFIRVKTEAMKVIQRKLELETTLRDHQQLLSFQSCFYSALEQHYLSRGVKYKNNLEDFHSYSQDSIQQLSSLRERLETMVTMLLGFIKEQDTQT